MKYMLTAVLALLCSTSFSQWTRVVQLPATDISSLYRKENSLYAGGNAIVYFSKDKGQTWDSTTKIPQFGPVDNIIIYKNELYAASFSLGVFKSSDEGINWQNITSGLLPFVSDFTEWRGNLFASTLGGSAFELDPVSGNIWLPFNNGLSSLSANLSSIASNSNALIAGTLANGLYDHLPANSNTWEERFLLGQINPTEGVYDIITSHDSLFLAGSTGRLYLSTDNGLTWEIVGNRIPSTFTTLANTKQALVFARGSFTGTNNTAFHYIKKDSLQGSSSQFSAVINHFTYKLESLGDRLWDASTEGLFFMPLSLLPGITADDSVHAIPLPVRFVSVNMKCDEDRIILNWKTAREQFSSHFDVERSVDGSTWTSIGRLPGAGNSGDERSYTFNDNHPLPHALYRIAQHDLNGSVQYSSVIGPSCATINTLSIWPNPVHDQLNVSITTTKESKAVLKVFDSKGAETRIKIINLNRGNNSFQVDMNSLPPGTYMVVIVSEGGIMEKPIKLLKQ